MIGKTDAVGKSGRSCAVVTTTIPSIAVVTTATVFDTTAATGSIPRWL